LFFFRFFSVSQSMLPLEYRARLQSSVMALSAEQQTAAVAQAQAYAHAATAPAAQSSAGTTAAGPSSADDRPSLAAPDDGPLKPSKKVSKKRDSSASVAGSAGSAPPAIELSMDFSKFSKKK
jgi:hypothetical protein